MPTKKDITPEKKAEKKRKNDSTPPESRKVNIETLAAEDSSLRTGIDERSAPMHSILKERASAVLPTTDELKAKFRQQSIPLQVDFWNLIDVADYGRKAVGMNPLQPGGSGIGLQLDDEERLAVLAIPGAGIDVTASGIGVKVNAGKSIEATASGVGVIANVGKGIEATASGVGVVANAGKGIEATASGVGVIANTSKGIEISSSGVAVKANVGKGIEATSNGVGVVVNAAKGIEATASGVGVIVNTSKGIEVSSSGVGVRIGSNLTFTSGLLEVSKTAFFGQHFALPYNTDFNTVVPPTYQPGVYGILNAGNYPNKPGGHTGLAANGFLHMFSHYNNIATDVAQIYFNASGQMWFRSKHDAQPFTPWAPLVQANASKAIESTDNGIGVVANAARGIIVGTAGVGINYGPTLEVVNNLLQVKPDVAFKRTSKRLTVNTNSPVYKTLIWTHTNSDTFAKISIVANGRQQFVLTLTGYHQYLGNGTAVLDISSVYKPSNAPIRSVRMAKLQSTGYGFAVELEIISNATIDINYSLFDIEGLQIFDLTAGSALTGITHSADLSSPVQITAHS